MPSALRLTPGQELRLSVGVPLHFYLPPQSPEGFSGREGRREIKAETGGICSTIFLKPIREGIADIELRIFGFPLRRVRVNVMRMPAVYLGGQAIGVLVAEEGVVVVGDTALRDDTGVTRNPAQEAGIKLGDLIMAINGQPIHQIDQLEQIVQDQSKPDTPLRLTVRRGSGTMEMNLKPVRQVYPEKGNKIVYRMGVYVEDPAAGVGTLTFYTLDKKFGALGHRIVGFGQRTLPLDNGRIVIARITGIRPGARGEPGEKIGVFTSNDDIIGTISANTSYGIFGTLHALPVAGLRAQPIPVLSAGEVRTGPAEILTVMSGEKVERFSIVIQKVYPQSQPSSKGMIIKVTDPELLRQAGGIIQGMSGSPIIQGGKLVGAVTHVFVNDPTQGYGVFAEWMLDAGGCLASEKEEYTEKNAS